MRRLRQTGSHFQEWEPDIDVAPRCSMYTKQVPKAKVDQAALYVPPSAYWVGAEKNTPNRDVSWRIGLTRDGT